MFGQASAPRAADGFALANSRQTIRPAGSSILDQLIAVDLDDVSLAVALDRIGEAAGTALTIDATNHSFLSEHVSLHAPRISVRDALASVLAGTGLQVEVPPGGGPAIVRILDASTLARQPAARAGVVTGVIRDAETGERLVSVLVSMAGTTFRALTREDGKYTLNGLPPGHYAIVTRRLGYLSATRELTLTDSQTVTLDLALAKSHALLDEVVTTGAGNAYALQVGNTIGTIRADSVVAKTGVVQLSDIITARVSGVQVFNAGGLVGVSPQVNIRGQNSVQLGDQPLLYIDGVRVANSMGNDFTAGASGRFNDVLPEEIESIEIIKGPAASALYGTDAANGIVVIHTKRGGVGRRQWNLWGETGSATVNTALFMDNYTGWGHTLDGTNTVVVCPLWRAAEHDCAQDSIPHFSPLKNGATTPFTPGGVNEIGMQVSGGGDTRYFLSGAYVEQGSYLKLPQSDAIALAAERGGVGVQSSDVHPNTLVKESGRANLTTPLSSNAEVAITAGYIAQTDRIPQSNAIDGAFGGPAYRDSSGGYAFAFRPLYVFVQHQQEEVQHFTIGAAPSWRPRRWLTVQGSLGVDAASLYTDQQTYPGEVPFLPGGYRQNGRDNMTTYSGTGTVSASFPIAVSVTSTTAAGVNYIRAIDHAVVGQAGSLTPGCTALGCAANPFSSETNADQITAGVFTEQTVGLNERLFLKVGVRSDGGSSFGSDYQTAVYPRASVSWLISSEPFVPHLPGLSLLRLRAAYGQAGVQPTAYGRYNGARVTGVYADSAVTSGAFLTQVGNPRIRPERQTEYEGGGDAEWFNGRFHVEGTYYSKRSSDALVNVALPTSLGGFAQQVNIGSVENLGYEALVSARVVESRFLSWDVAVNGSVNHNKLVRFAPGVNTCGGASIGAQSCVGYPLFSYFNYPFSYSDRNHDGIIDTNEVAIGTTVRFLGQSYPKTQLSMEHTVSLWNGQLQLRALADYRGGFVLYESGVLSSAKALYAPGSSLHDQAVTLAAAQGAASNLTDGSFTRLRDVAVTVSLPDALSRRAHIRRASVTVSGMNLFVWTKFKGGDPEENGGTGSPQSGAYQPGSGLIPARTWVVRLNLGL